MTTLSSTDSQPLPASSQPLAPRGVLPLPEVPATLKFTSECIWPDEGSGWMCARVTRVEASQQTRARADPWSGLWAGRAAYWRVILLTPQAAEPVPLGRVLPPLSRWPEGSVSGSPPAPAMRGMVAATQIAVHASLLEHGRVPWGWFRARATLALSEVLLEFPHAVGPPTRAEPRRAASRLIWEAMLGLLREHLVRCRDAEAAYRDDAPGVAGLGDRIGSSLEPALHSEPDPDPGPEPEADPGSGSGGRESLTPQPSDELDAPHPRLLPLDELSAVMSYMQRRVEADGAADLDVVAIAEYAGYSPFYFTRIFKRSTGETPHACLVRLRVQQMYDLLHQEQDVPLANLALRCGFADQSHMNRHFKRHYGQPPGVFRRLALQADD